MYTIRSSSTHIQIIVESAVRIQSLLLEEAHLRCSEELFHHWDCFDKDLGAVFAVGYEVCKSGFVGEVVAIRIS